MKRGIDVHFAFSYYKAEMLAQFCDLFKPDVILEIDRTRNNAPGMTNEVVSIAWVQDWRSVSDTGFSSSTDRFGGSELYYFCVQPSVIGVDTSKLNHWSYLLQATDPDVYFPEDVPIESDFSLMGYIPEKKNLDQLDMPLPVELIKGQVTVGAFGTVRQLVEALNTASLTWNTYDPMQARRVTNKHVRSTLGIHGDSVTGFTDPFGNTLPPGLTAALANDNRCLVPDQVMLLIENGILRALGRIAVVNGVLDVSRSLRIFGVGQWQTYSEYMPYYHGPAMRESDVRRIHCSTRINLHNAMTQMHSRALDCMASGSVIMVNKMLHNNAEEPDCMRAHFEPGIHYFEYGEDDIGERAKELMADEEARRKTGKIAREVVLAKHTWAHRVDQILTDLAQL